MNNKEYDLIIIGAGPSGSSAARRASQRNLNTLIIAKDVKHPKKILSEFLAQIHLKDNCKFSGHLIPVGGIKRTLISSKVILVGDAGGFIEIDFCLNAQKNLTKK